ncbi:hypothetical protein AB1Y20_002617 [Prymnesium parvum]|uniref:Rho GDP-dissociation inhibitor n=1 Tax=Prymnesium parvum TaxID=97485 RepID=A0AB34J9T0_PRYPA|eukprot:CAMPEP_0182835868 /NCGR_PEP_ID=MMETSP0006_2-20121128/21756_1 /TAXON_ID=97485 /ORGANISM="Prymnesium parvum, Strain Texoma1" /LENGTH=198 /DNA_ID=CAMNT_0024964367 /DNA_START=16 /DNA_END=612 /DNA_ORIENTATION=-
MSETDATAEAVEKLTVEEDNYTPPEPKSVEELMAQKEGEDEALQRYKASLLGAGAASTATDDPRRVVVTEVGIIPSDHAPIMLDMTSDQPKKIVLKEGCSYRLQFGFRVQNQLVSGLKYSHVVTRRGIKVDSAQEMLGSYGPDPQKVNTVQVPRRDWETAPSGMLARATYTVKSAFTDDDKVEHLSFSFELEVKKDWA